MKKPDLFFRLFDISLCVDKCREMFLQLLEFLFHIPRLQHICADKLVELTQYLNTHRLVKQAESLHALHTQYFHHPLCIPAGCVEPLHLFAAAFIVLLVDAAAPGSAQVERPEIIFDMQGLVCDGEHSFHFTSAEPADLEKGNRLFCFVGKMCEQDAVCLVFV